jgi:hypothetical protein
MRAGKSSENAERSTPNIKRSTKESGSCRMKRYINYQLALWRCHHNSRQHRALGDDQSDDPFWGDGEHFI